MIEALIIVCNIGYEPCSVRMALRQYTQTVPESECGRSFPGDGKSRDGWPVVDVGEVRRVECIYKKTATAPMTGMYLCPDTADAGYFWTDITKAEELKVPMTAEVWRNIAAKNSCPFYQSESFKPTKQNG